MCSSWHKNNHNISVHNATAPQDAHKRLVMQVAEWLTAPLYKGSREVSNMS